jgi:hypothetical protein
MIAAPSLLLRVITRYLLRMHTLLTTLTTVTDTSSAAAAGALAGAFIGGLIGYLIVGLAYYGIFAKAGEAGWQGFVPIWNAVVLLKIAGKPAWWIVLFFIPVVNLVVAIIVMNALSLSFGHGSGFTLGLIFLSPIFMLVLAFSSNTYRGPSGVSAAPIGYAAA